jgi:uncharacterized protein YegJ (DUF2314 family)
MDDDPQPTIYTPNILWINGDNPEMVAAIREAQRTFHQYREALSSVESVVDDCGVKVFFPASQDPQKGEHMWVNEVEFRGNDMVGTLCNDPDWIRGFACDDRVTFTLDRVSDWFFVVDDVLHGGFTLKLLFRHYSPEQFAECRDDPPACYLARWYDELTTDH